MVSIRSGAVIAPSPATAGGCSAPAQTMPSRLTQSTLPLRRNGESRVLVLLSLAMALARTSSGTLPLALSAPLEASQWPRAAARPSRHIILGSGPICRPTTAVQETLTGFVQSVAGDDRPPRRFVPQTLIGILGSRGFPLRQPTRLQSARLPDEAMRVDVPPATRLPPLAGGLPSPATRVPGSACRQARSQQERAAGDPCACPCSCPRMRTYLPEAP
jgi:hypothetical protein